MSRKTRISLVPYGGRFKSLHTVNKKTKVSFVPYGVCYNPYTRWSERQRYELYHMQEVTIHAYNKQKDKDATCTILKKLQSLPKVKRKTKIRLVPYAGSYNPCTRWSERQRYDLYHMEEVTINSQGEQKDKDTIWTVWRRLQSMDKVKRKTKIRFVAYGGNCNPCTRWTDVNIIPYGWSNYSGSDTSFT